MIRQVLVTLIAASVLTACSSFKVIDVHDQTAHSKIKMGDTVRVVKIDGEQLELMALNVTSEALIGKDQATFRDRKILLDEIALLERRSRVKEDVLIYGGIATVLLVIANNIGPLKPSK